ncbi:MAG: peptidoglycan-binding protein [Alphaproteobacteria bacterium]|nr:peptidoglycan-binding protein [Alphaproteobacteria bacterium]
MHPAQATSCGDYQTILASLGHYDGALDGLAGPKTTKAVFAFQKDHPHLKTDGVLGPATAAALKRAAAIARPVRQPVSGAGFRRRRCCRLRRRTGMGAVGCRHRAWLAALGGAVVAWRYRDEIRHRVRNLFKRRASA